MEPRPWVPAFAGTTVLQGSPFAEIFAKLPSRAMEPRPWVPAFAGTTVLQGSPFAETFAKLPCTRQGEQ